MPNLVAGAIENNPPTPKPHVMQALLRRDFKIV